MRSAKLLKLATLLLSLVALQGHTAPQAMYWAFWDSSNEQNRQVINHSQWDEVLRQYAVLDQATGIVSFSYGTLNEKDVKKIRNYVAELEEIDPRGYPKLEQKAYWMNLYNALTVLAVKENYQSLSDVGFNRGLDPSAWNKKRVKVVKQDLSLNDIEHRILRPIFKDHKILFGLNCTTLDCPNLSERAYTAKTIKSQLKTAGVRFINNNIGLRYSDGVLSASRLFSEYMSDFASDEKTLRKVFAHYAQDMKALYVLGYTGNINYMRDPRLNIH